MLDIDDSVCTLYPGPPPGPPPAWAFTRPPLCPAQQEAEQQQNPLGRELGLILREIRVITDKVRQPSGKIIVYKRPKS